MTSAGETSGQSIIEMESTTRTFPSAIFEIPAYLRDRDPGAYEPTIISFGPYHYGKETLKAMEDVKGEYRDSLIRKNPKNSYADYLKAVRMIKDIARYNYSNFVSIRDEKFVQMMTLDGCVIIELISRLIIEERGKVNMNIGDPIILDMILLENQIPFIVLETIWAVQAAGSQILPLFRYFVQRMRKIYSPNADVEVSFDNHTKPVHLLHLLDLVMFSNSAQGVAQNIPQNLSIPCLTHLLNRGVKLKQDNYPGPKVTFFEGVITMTPLKITEHTVKYFRNLVAFEQCYTGEGATLKTSTYVVHMNSLIQGPQDLDALSSRGQRILIWDPKEIKREHVANMFKDLSQGLSRYEEDKDFSPPAILYWLNNPEVSRRMPPKIFRVPDRIRNLNPNAFEPRVVSFGPYHRGKVHLQHVEGQKWHYRDEIMATFKKNWDGCLQVVREVEDKAKLYYEGMGDEKDCAEMMALDGCFMIHILTSFSNPAIDNDARRDMMLIENQIPFIILQKISQYLDCLPRLRKCLIEFVRGVYSPLIYGAEEDFSHLPFHLVDLLRSEMFPPATFTEIYYAQDFHGKLNSTIIPRLSQLKRRGVKIVSKAEPGLEVAFALDQGELSINRHIISRNMEIYPQNFIAFEQNYWPANKKVSSYAVLMNNLICSIEDVEVLTSTNPYIMINKLISEEEVVHLFKNLCMGIEKFDVDPCLADSINKYVKSRRRKWIGELKENYLKSPLLFISAFGAFLLLLLTLVQTVFAVLSFFIGSKSR